MVPRLLRLAVFLDSTPLSELAHPKTSGAFRAWLVKFGISSSLVAIPAIADYEVRRELLRLGRAKSIERLDELSRLNEFVPVTQPALLLAAEFWARVRREGRPTAGAEALDADVILAAQAATWARDTGDDIIVATSNARHLARFVPAAHWTEIVAP